MPGKSTKTQDVYNALALEIARGRMLPGTPLDETQVASRYGVSRTPIREAIRKLESAGLVEVRAHYGAVVKRITETELDDMFAVMAELEAVSARWCSTGMTTEERHDLRAIHDRAEAFVAGNDAAGYSAANDDFHAAIYAGAHNTYLHELTRTVRHRVAPFRRAQFDEAGRLGKSFGEHTVIVDAIERRDGDAAYAAMRTHIVVVRTAVEHLTRDAAVLQPSIRAQKKRRSRPVHAG